MFKSHDVIEPRKYDGNEQFTLAGTKLSQNIMDFWRWMGSDLLDNTMRGILAEYIVAYALGITDQRYDAWREYDLLFEGHKIEVKSSSYLQSWFQKKYSRISFNIAPHQAWDPEIGALKDPKMRHADMYVLCILETKDIDKLDPLDLDQWVFYLIPTKQLDEKFPKQKTLSETALNNLGIKSVKYGALKENILNQYSQFN